MPLAGGAADAGGKRHEQQFFRLAASADCAGTADLTGFPLGGPFVTVPSS